MKGNLLYSSTRGRAFILLVCGIGFCPLHAQHKTRDPLPPVTGAVQYGTASYYSEKFNGRLTSSGETYNSKKFTAAHNTLPLGTWIKVTNLRNKKSVIVKVNDRLHPKNKRLVDLSRAAAQKLGYINSGLTKVRVEVLGKNPKQSL